MKSDLRVELTKRLLKEGLLRCMERTPLSRITVSALCREADVNRATFYHHYTSPAAVLRDITFDYARALKEVCAEAFSREQDESQAAVACLSYLQDRKTEIRVLFSENAEDNVARFALEIVDAIVGRPDVRGAERGTGGEDDYLLAVVASSACYGLIRAWIVDDIDKTPEELVAILQKAFGGVLPTLMY